MKFGKNGILKFNIIRCDVLDLKVLFYNCIFKIGSFIIELLIMSLSLRMNYVYKIGKGLKMWMLEKEKNIFFVVLICYKLINGGCGFNEICNKF